MSKSASLSRPHGTALGGFVCLLLLLALLVRGEELHTSDPHEVMAGYLRALPAYVQWPTNKLATPTQPWHIGILGDDPFGDTLTKVLKDRQAAGRSFTVYHAEKLADLPACEIIFVALKNESELKSTLAQLCSHPVLTVGEADNFLELGGIIELRARKTVQMAINLDRAQRAGLKIPGKMLEVASEVIENGKLRKIK